MVLNGHPTFCVTACVRLAATGRASTGNAICNPTPRPRGFTSLCRLALHRVRVTCVQIRYQDCKTSRGFKAIPVMDAHPTPTSRHEALGRTARSQRRSANLLFYGACYIPGKFAGENFSIIPHLGVDCTRPVEQTRSLTLIISA